MTKLLAARGSQPSARPFYTVLFLLSTFAIYSFLLHSGKTRSHNSQPNSPLIQRDTAVLECRDVHDAEDQCAFVREYCGDDDAGLIKYLEFYYCSLGNAQWLAFIVLASWLGLLFTTIGIAASDFFSINLSTISTILGLSESLAGVTFLAFGNGSPDVFSTFAAMASNSASMAVGELIGAACFITGVVAGSMCLVREFRVDRKTYTRDILFFIVALAFTMVFLTDGRLFFWECWAMVGYYVLYVVFVVGWHWYSTRRKRQLRREGEARSHFYGLSVGHDADELAGEPYRDDPDDTDRAGSQHLSIDSDITTLENGPRIEIDGHEPHGESLGDEDSEEDHERMLAAEVTRSMRVLRPSGKRTTSTMTPIRPSLVGALEFRSALAQLQRESNLQLSSMNRSGDASRPRIRRGTTSAVRALPNQRSDEQTSADYFHAGRDRALSSGHTPISTSMPPAFLIGDLDPDSAAVSSEATPAGSLTPSAAHSHPYTIGGSLAPPPTSGNSPALLPNSQHGHQQEGLRPKLHLQTLTRNSSHSDLSSPAMPFPPYTDSPMLMTPHTVDNDGASFVLPPPSVPQRESSLTVPRTVSFATKPVRWWPYSMLPAPHIFLATLFPTLQGWADKTYWDKFVSALSVPSIFMLVITLPVVESDHSDDEIIEDAAADHMGQRQTGSRSPALNGLAEPEGEWERYQRHNLSRSSSTHALNPPSPGLVSFERDETLVAQQQHPNTDSSSVAFKPVSDVASASNETEEALAWNRWLVGLQLFTGPLFAVFVLWANMAEEMDNPKKELVRMVLYTLLASLILLAAMILFTVEHKRPKHHYVLCFMGFIISIAWISTIAGEVVGVLKAVGVVLDISEALLGLTIFAAGNSIGDLVANITVARLGYPVMAL